MTETTKAATPTATDDRITVRDLERGQRGLFALVGMGGLLAGGVAVFESGNQAGTVALLAVGSVASLLSVVGKIPLRWVIGGNEFDLSERAAIEVAEEVASRLTPPETAELAGRLTHLDAGRRSSMTTAMVDYVAFEQTAIARVMQALATTDYAYTSGTVDRGFDGMVVGPKGALPVEYKFGRSPGSLERVVRRFRNSQGSSSYSDVLLIVGGAQINYPRLTTELSGLSSPRVHLIELDDPEFEKTLRAIIESHL